ncbi:MAG: iron-containing redox enzyme family protein [Bdellovibrionales bacterium]
MNLLRETTDLNSLYTRELEKIGPLFKGYPWEVKYAYAMWCGQMYYFIRNATRLLAAAAARLDVSNDSLHWAFGDHIQGEKHHEKLLVNDLMRMGFKVDDFPEFPEIATVYQTAFYMIDYQNPAALYGTILYLESLSLTWLPAIFDRCQALYGKTATTFLRVHVAEDVDHIGKAFRVIDSMNPDQCLAVQNGIILASTTYYQFMERLTQVQAFLLENQSVTVESAEVD